MIIYSEIKNKMALKPYFPYSLKPLAKAGALEENIFKLVRETRSMINVL